MNNWNDRLYALWSDFYKPIAALFVFGSMILVAAVGRALGFGPDHRLPYGTLVIIGSVALGFGAMAATERLLFGRRPKQRIAGWLKVVLGIGAVVGIAVAVWDGMEGRRMDDS